MATTAAPALTRRILLVDDDTITLDLLSHIFHHAGYTASKAASGAAALAAIAQQEYDLALLDVNMPDMSGLELARQLQAKLPFMFLTSNNDISMVRQAADYGAVGYLVKPFEHGQIVPAVEAALARADEIRQLRRTEANLTAALAAGRETSMAVGLLMARLQTDRNTAFEVLRDYARSNRCKLNEVAQELLAAEERVGLLKSMASRHKPT